MKSNKLRVDTLVGGALGCVAVSLLLLIETAGRMTGAALGAWAVAAVIVTQLVLLLVLWQHRAVAIAQACDWRRDASLMSPGTLLPPSVVHELDALRSANHELHERAMHDPLTGLPNRALFEELLAAELSVSRRHTQRPAVLFVDLDRFKAVNDALGHAAGDGLLLAVTRRMRDVLRESDVLCRLAGDEFLILLRNAGPRAEIAATCERLLAALARPHALAGGAITVNASAGIACYPHDGTDVASLVVSADQAMYEAKRLGRGQWRFHSFDEAAYGTLPPGERRLAQALLRDELALHYQPICLTDGTIVGTEALLRWPLTGERMIGPMEFVASAERSGLIGELSSWTLRHACGQMARWRAQGHDLSLAVNISPLELRDLSLPDRVAEALSEAGLPAAALELEITETALMQDCDASRHLLQRLRGIGVRLSIDDFGVGYSSLAHLRQLRPHRLKIDRTFIAGADHDAEAQALLAALIALARTLKIAVVAEGVESAAQRDFLVAHGCDFLQGHLLGEAMPADAFRQLLERGVVTDAPDPHRA